MPCTLAAVWNPLPLPPPFPEVTLAPALPRALTGLRADWGPAPGPDVSPPAVEPVHAAPSGSLPSRVGRRGAVEAEWGRDVGTDGRLPVVDRVGAIGVAHAWEGAGEVPRKSVVSIALPDLRMGVVCPLAVAPLPVPMTAVSVAGPSWGSLAPGLALAALSASRSTSVGRIPERCYRIEFAIASLAAAYFSLSRVIFDLKPSCLALGGGRRPAERAGRRSRCCRGE